MSDKRDFYRKFTICVNEKLKKSFQGKELGMPARWKTGGYVNDAEQKKRLGQPGRRHEAENPNAGSRMHERPRGGAVMPRAPMCPFYGRTKKAKLVCLMGGADTTGADELEMNFPTQMSRVRYWVDFCCGDWERCTLADALWSEYEKQTAATKKKCACAAGKKACAAKKPKVHPAAHGNVS